MVPLAFLAALPSAASFIHGPAVLRGQSARTGLCLRHKISTSRPIATGRNQLHTCTKRGFSQVANACTTTMPESSTGCIRMYALFVRVNFYLYLFIHSCKAYSPSRKISPEVLDTQSCILEQHNYENNDICGWIRATYPT